MFYLTQFLKLFRDWPIRGISYIAMTLLLILASSQYHQIGLLLNSYWKVERDAGHFYALMPTEENSARIGRKIRALPGVKSVNLLSKENLNTKLKQIVEEVGLEDDIGSLSNLSYVGIKIQFDDAVSAQSMKLIRDYLVRLVGEDKIVLGRIYKAEAERSHGFFQKWLPHIFILVITIFWGIIAIVFNLKILQKGYLLEQFQRRKQVAFKLLFMGNIILCMLSGFVSLFFNTNNYSIALCFSGLIVLLSTINLKKYSWK